MTTTAHPAASSSAATPNADNRISDRQLRRLRWAVRATLALGVAASVAANVLHARPNPISQIIAAWPPLALLLTVELISRVPHHRWYLGAIRVTAATVIAVIAAWVSYWHLVGVAARYGESSYGGAYLLPISVDGLVTAASVSLVEISARIRIASPASATPAATEPAAAPAAPAAPHRANTGLHPEPDNTVSLAAPVPSSDPTPDIAANDAGGTPTPSIPHTDNDDGPAQPPAPTSSVPAPDTIEQPTSDDTHDHDTDQPPGPVTKTGNPASDAPATPISEAPPPTANAADDNRATAHPPSTSINSHDPTSAPDDTAAAVAYWRHRDPTLQPADVAARIGRSERTVWRHWPTPNRTPHARGHPTGKRRR